MSVLIPMTFMICVCYLVTVWIYCKCKKNNKIDKENEDEIN